MRTLTIASMVALLPGLALGQGREPRNFSLERMRPAMDHRGVLDIDSGIVPEHLEWEAAFLLGYVNDPLVLNMEQDGEVERVASVVGNRVTGSLVGAVGLYQWVQLGVELPVVFYQGRGENLDQYNTAVRELTTGGIGDLRLAPKVRVLRAEEFFVDVAVIPGFTFPTASSRAYLGDRMMTFVPEVAVSKKIAMIRVATNVGMRFRSRTQTETMVVDDELTYRAGAAYDFGPMLEVPLEAAVSLSGSTGLKVPFRKPPRNPLELLLGANYQATRNLVAFAGLGAGLSAGYSTPDFRLFAGVRFVPGEEPPPPRSPVADLDGDGILDPVDSCPNDPEDKDQFEDEDGCPDVDNDGDGIVDVDDQCPMDAEDADQFEDDNGCPDNDNDTDGILDADDRCPLQPETENGWEDEDGCPEDIPDSDQDGIADNVDKCPQKPEDKDGFEDTDGCPDADNDGDGVMDIVDQCPMEPGTMQSSGCPDQDRDGDTVIDQMDVCPDTPGSPEFSGCPKKQLVKLSAEKIEILEKVYFGTSSDLIKEQSYQLLDSVAKVLNEHPEIQRIRIEGHTDSRGAAEFNKDLSQRRASSVRAYLIGKGVAEARLEALGLGEEKPIASNESTPGRAANRRVEFLIVKEQENKTD